MNTLLTLFLQSRQEVSLSPVHLLPLSLPGKESMERYILRPILLSFCFLFLMGERALLKAQPLAPKREFRAAWIATVGNIDWPSKQGLSALQQQQEFIQRLETIKAMGGNAVIVQIRPACDALYKSSIEPWSRYLSGRQGQPPFPYYDPLEFMIEETHKRQMEFHAWFNPFRALVDNRSNPNPPGHVTRTHPEWIINYGTKAYLNPGEPAVREYVIRVIMDVVKRYDIDAVHLDDYFYPYRIPKVEFADAKSYARYGGDFSSKDDWRRNNINLFISVLNTNIKQVKPYVKLGISPFGVWRNASVDPRGSATRGGQTTYDDLYADVLLWMEKGWVDYMLPQLYWEHGHRAAPFEVLLPWWEKHTYGRHMYYGLGAYRMVNAVKEPWVSPRELLSQISDIRRTSQVPGFSLYSISSFDKVPPAVLDSLRMKYCAAPALVPVMKWLDSIPPPPPVITAIPSAQGTLLKWQAPAREPLRYVVYRFVNDEPMNLEHAGRILDIVSGTEFLDPRANDFRKCTYIVTSLDRLWNESTPSNTAVTSLE
jgi:uncharacterized lipoprotein YddW (UPF0748 family)